MASLLNASTAKTYDNDDVSSTYDTLIQLQLTRNFHAIKNIVNFLRDFRESIQKRSKRRHSSIKDKVSYSLYFFYIL